MNSAEANVRRYYRLVDSGDTDGLVALFTDDAVYHRPGYPPIVGRRALESFYREARIIACGSHTITELVAGESNVAVHGDFAGTLKDGTEVSLRFADFFRVTDEARFSRRDTFFFAPSV